jgi:predicted nucleic acid-binding protein
VIVDTTVWIDYLRGTDKPETRWLDREWQRQRLGLTDLILGEVLHGIRERSSFDRVREDLLKFHIFETGGVDLALTAVQNNRKLRQRGPTVRKTIDCLSGTSCLEHGHALLHRDGDFDAFEKALGLGVIHS